jgi:hypothetical protein
MVRGGHGQVLHTPGVPNAYGSDAINMACQVSHSQVNPLISFQELNVGVRPPPPTPTTTATTRAPR